VRAGIYMLGDSSVCPSGYTGIADSIACQSAAAAYISTWQTNPVFTTCGTACPSGCNAIYSSGTVAGVYFAAAASGTLSSNDRKPICIGAPRSAPRTSASRHRDPSLVLPVLYGTR
jgi:hypothetical protein